MAFEGDEDYCIIDKEDYEYPNDDELNHQPKKVIHQFYFVKFNRNFVDHSVEARIDELKRLIDRLDREKRSFLSQIQSIEFDVQKRIEKVEGSYSESYRNDSIRNLRQSLAQYWPETTDEDPEEAMDPEMEDVKIKERIENLTWQLGHGNHKIGEEKRLLREVKHMKLKNEELHRQVKEAVVEVPRRGKWDTDTTRSKYQLQRYLRSYLTQKKQSKEEQEQQNAGDKKEIRKAKEKLCFTHQKQAKIHNRILIAQKIIDEQVCCYDEYMTLLRKAKELAAQKDLVALEELSCKQVEEFMRKWKSNKEFRANYKRSAHHI